MITPQERQINAAAAALLAYALMRGLLLASIVPPWQGADEPGHFEYALLLSARAAAATGAAEGAPAGGDRSLQGPIVRSMRDHAFFRHTAAAVPPPGASRFEDVPRLGSEVIQEGDETPVGYLPFAAALAVLPDGDVADVLLRLRLVSVALVLVLAGLALHAARLMLPTAAAGVAVALVVAGPMVGFTGAVVNPDLTAAVLVAAWLCAVEHRLIPAEGRARPAVALALALALASWSLVLLAAAAKRTALFVVPLAIGIEIALAAGGGRLAWLRRPRSADRHRAARGGGGDRPVRAAPAVAAAIVLALVLAGPIRGQADGWRVVGMAWGDVRTERAARDGAWGLRIVDASPDGWQYVERVIELGTASGDAVRQVEATAWLRRAPVEAAGEAPAALPAPERASLVVNDTGGTWLADVVELPSDGAWVRARVSGDVPASTESLRIALVPGDGTVEGIGALDADGMTLSVDGAPVDVNGGAERPVRRGAAWAAWTLSYTAARRILASAASGAAAPEAALDRAASALAFTFRSAWGGFGWLTLWPGAAHYAVAGLVTAFAVVAAAVALFAPARLAPDPDRARFLRWCAIGAVLALTIAIVGSVAGTAAHKQPQGRYLIPALLPLALPAAALAERWSPRRGPAVLAALVLGLDLAAIGWVIWPGFQ